MAETDTGTPPVKDEREPISPCWCCGEVPEVRSNPPLVGGFHGNYLVYCHNHCDETPDGEPRVTAFGSTQERAIYDWNIRCEMESGE